MLSIGIIGSGFIGGVHCKNLQENDEVDRIGVVDVLEEKRNLLARRYSKVKPFATIEQMLNEISPQAVYVCTPPFKRDFISGLVEKGLSLFIEKPVGLDLKEGVALNSLIDKKKIICAVGYHWRFLDFLPVIRDLQLSRQDTPVSIRGYWLGPFYNSPWWGNSKLSGGQIVEQATHVVDFMRLVGKEVILTSGYGHTGAAGDDNGFCDSANASLVFENGAIGSFSTSCILAVGNIPKAGVDVIYNGLSFSMYRGGPLLSDYRLVINRGLHVEEIRSQTDLFAAEDKEFITSVLSSQASHRLCTYNEAVRTLNLSLAINKSVTERKEVKLEKLTL